MAFLLLSSIICFTTAFIQLYYSNFKVDNYFNITQYYSNAINWSIDSDDLSGDEVYSKHNSSSAQNKQIELLSNSVDNKTLVVTPSQNISSINEYRNNISFLIKIPYSYSNNININTSNGNIDLSNLNIKNLNIKTTNSDVSINKDSNLTLSYSTINGSLYRDSYDESSDYLNNDNILKLINGDGKVNIKTVNGDLNLSE